MIRIITGLIFLLLTNDYCFGQNNVRLVIKSSPPYQPSNSEIYLAGTCNGWNPNDKIFRFSKNDSGLYFLDMKLFKGSYEFKLTGGDWNKVECTAKGVDIPNRKIEIDADTVISVNVEGWKDHFTNGSIKPKSTAGKNVHILDSAFWIPQLHRKRRIWIYLPDGYVFLKIEKKIISEQLLLIFSFRLWRFVRIISSKF